MSSNLQDILGMHEKEREAAQFLAEILKLLTHEKEEFIENVKVALEDPSNLLYIIPHLSMKKKNREQAIKYLTRMSTSLQIAATPVPGGFVGDLEIAKTKYRGFLVEILSVFRREDFQILADLGLKMKRSIAENKKEAEDPGVIL